jgi:Fe2+ or Zn2+ uptake regulation protein
VRRHGYRLTPQRQIILDALCEMGGHVTVAELYERVHGRYPAIDRSTVYRALDFFGELGLVAAAEAGGATVYEIAPEGPAHYHLICNRCGEVKHVPGEIFNELTGKLRADFDFEADLGNLSVHGVCSECNAANAA